MYEVKNKTPKEHGKELGVKLVSLDIQIEEFVDEYKHITDSDEEKEQFWRGFEKIIFDSAFQYGINVGREMHEDAFPIPHLYWKMNYAEITDEVIIKRDSRYNMMFGDKEFKYADIYDNYKDLWNRRFEAGFRAADKYDKTDSIV